LASTDAGPVVNWFDQSNDDAKANYSIYMATLQKETISPLAKESDEEKIKEPADTAKAKKKRQPKTSLQLIGMALKTEY
jgi:tricorn protease